MSSNFKYTAGLRNVGSYQISGHPFMSGSTISGANKCQMIEFPYVCRSITVINTGASNDMRIHFQSGSGVTEITLNGATGEQNIADTADVIALSHFITVPKGDGSMTVDVRSKNIYLSCGASGGTTYQIFAELTSIPTERMYHLTGSGITE
jgi:hypothetical protein